MTTLKGHANDVSKIVISPDGRLLASIANECAIRVWSLLSGACVALLEIHDKDSPTDISFSPCNRYLAVSTKTGIVVLFRTGNMPQRMEKRTYFSYQSDTFPEFDPESFLSKPPPTERVHSLKQSIVGISFSLGGTFIVVCFEKGEIGICMTRSNYTSKTHGHSNSSDGVLCLKKSTSKFLSWSSKGGEIKLWQANPNVSQIRSFSVRQQNRRNHLISLALSCDESFLFAITSNSAFVWNLNDSSVLMSVDDLSQCVFVSGHPIVPSIFAVVIKTKILLFDVCSTIPFHRLDIPIEQPKLKSMIWSPDGFSIAATDTQGGVNIFRVSDSPKCRILQQFFEIDSTPSEWIPGKGQMEDKSMGLVHNQKKNTLLDIDGVAQIQGYVPVKLTDIDLVPTLDPQVFYSMVVEEELINLLLTE